MKNFILAATLLAFAVAASPALASEGCDAGEVVIKFSHYVAETHPKGVSANLLVSRVKKEMNGKACMDVYPNSTLYVDNIAF